MQSHRYVVGWSRCFKCRKFDFKLPFIFSEDSPLVRATSTIFFALFISNEAMMHLLSSVWKDEHVVFGQ